jgi:toxin ParE1/3/4
LIERQNWYEREAAGLGRHFRKAIDALTERLSANEPQFPIVFNSVHRALARRFPYELSFIIEGDTSLVMACFHASRDPLPWQKRTYTFTTRRYLARNRCLI